jgi:hypothetical protein
MTYWSDVVQRLWEVESVKSFVEKYAGGLKEAFRKYKECSLKATKRCDRIVFGERFLRSTILYWLLLPVVIVFALPVVALLIVTGFLRLIVRTLVYMGISIRCMLSALWIAIEALIIYIVASLLWWFFTCKFPFTLDILISVCIRIYNAIYYLLTEVWVATLWYLHLIIPCWFLFPLDRTGYSNVAIAIGLGALICGAVGLILAAEGEEFVGVILLIAFVVLIVAMGAVCFVGSEYTDRTYTGYKVDSYCDGQSRCAIEMSDGLEYYSGSWAIKDLAAPGNHTIGVLENERDIVCDRSSVSVLGTGVVQSPYNCKEHLIVRSILWVDRT